MAIDYDRVEKSNLNRQLLYRESDVGDLKTAAAARSLKAMSSSCELQVINQRIEAAEDLHGIVDNADLVVCAIDEPPFLAQRRVNLACVRAGVPCLYAVSQITRGRLFSVLPYESGCFDCLNIHYTIEDPLFVPQFAGFQRLDFDPPTIAFAPDIFRLCGAVAHEAVWLLTGFAPPQTVGTQFEVDFESGRAYPLLGWPRQPEHCPTCGAGREEDWEVFSLYRGSVAR